MEHHVVLRVITKLLLPFIFLFGLYVQFHGDFGPGGGFQAGVIFGAGFVLYGLIFGLANTQQIAPPPVVRFTAAFGLVLYIGVGIVSLLRGGNYLDYNVLSNSPVAGQHLGIMLIEFGVGITVASVMVNLFYGFAGYVRDDKEE